MLPSHPSCGLEVKLISSHYYIIEYQTIILAILLELLNHHLYYSLIMSLYTFSFELSELLF